MKPPFDFDIIGTFVVKLTKLVDLLLIMDTVTEATLYEHYNAFVKPGTSI